MHLNLFFSLGHLRDLVHGCRQSWRYVIDLLWSALPFAYLIVFFLPLGHWFVHIFCCLVEGPETIVLQDLIWREIKLIGHWLRLWVIEVLELVILDVKDVINQSQISPWMIKHCVNIGLSVQNQKQGLVLLRASLWWWLNPIRVCRVQLSKLFENLIRDIAWLNPN